MKRGDMVWYLVNDGDATTHPSGPHRVELVEPCGGAVHLENHTVAIPGHRVFATEEQAWTAVLITLRTIAGEGRRAADICDRRADEIREALLHKQIKFL